MKVTRGDLKLWSSGEKLLHGALHSRLSFISHSKPGDRSVTLINRPARNTNQYCRGIINPLCSQSPLQKVKLKLIEITFCWLIVALSWVKEEVDRWHVCRYQESMGLMLVGEVQQGGVMTAEECFIMKLYRMLHLNCGKRATPRPQL